MAKAKRPFKNLVARRELTVDRSRNRVIVEIGKPYADDRCHTCPMQIKFGKRVVQNDIHGIDDFQALDLALKYIAFELRYNGQLPVGRMYLEIPGDDMGFPDPNWVNRPGDLAQ